MILRIYIRYATTDHHTLPPYGSPGTPPTRRSGRAPPMKGGSAGLGVEHHTPAQYRGIRNGSVVGAYATVGRRAIGVGTRAVRYFSIGAHTS
eukprot:912427-Rhodomonas_salina.1